jgi:hypothetical protein
LQLSPEFQGLGAILRRFGSHFGYCRAQLADLLLKFLNCGSHFLVLALALFASGTLLERGSRDFLLCPSAGSRAQ